MSRRCDEYKTRRTQLQEQLDGLKHISGMLNKYGTEKLENEAKHLCDRLAVSYVEGMLLALYQTKATKEIYKTKTHSIKKLSKNFGIVWEDIHPRLQERAVKALKLSM